MIAAGCDGGCAKSKHFACKGSLKSAKESSKATNNSFLQIHPSSNKHNTSSSSDQLQRSARENLKKLDVKRKAVETEAAAIVDELLAPPPDDANGEPMGVDTPLVDADGYPRADIDVFRARTLRHRLNEIRTDHKELMRQVEAGMVKCATFSKRDDAADEEERRRRMAPKPKPKFDPKTGKWAVSNWDGTVAGVEHGEDRRFERIGTADDVLPGEAGAASGADGAATSGAMPSTSGAAEQKQPLVPFALVDGVSSDSPAAEAGLMEGDLLLRFGPVHHLNHRDLRAVLELVPTAAANQEEIAITLLRREQPSVEPGWTHAAETTVRCRMVVKIRPRPWAGRGLLGCHIKAYDDAQLDTAVDAAGH